MTLRFAVILALAVVPLLSTNASAGPNHPHVFGVGPGGSRDILQNPPDYDQSLFERLRDLGVTASRVGVGWPDIEPQAGIRDWVESDSIVSLCNANGIEPYYLIVDTPGWCSPTGSRTHEYPPEDQYAPQFEAFCQALASRYIGSVTRFEFWNEQNGYGWHTDDGFNHADEYLPWLRRAYNALKAGNPDCIVALGGMDDADGNAPIYLNLVYSYRDQWYPGETLFDAIADHPYGSAGSAIQKVAALRNIMLANGDDKPIWLTEYGWTATNEDDTNQAQQLQLYLEAMVSEDMPTVTMANYLTLTDFGQSYGGFGLTDHSMFPREAYYVFQEFPKGNAPAIARVDARPTDANTVTVTFTTSSPATCWVEHGLDDTYGASSSVESVPSQQHSTVLEDLVPNQAIHFRVHATATGMAEGTTIDKIVVNPGTTMFNADFEGEYNLALAQGWHRLGSALMFEGGNLESIFGLGLVHGGSHSQAMVGAGIWHYYFNDAMASYAHVPTGREYTFSVYTRGTDLDQTNSSMQIRRRVGTDPTGGMNPDAATVVWSSWKQQNLIWDLQEVTATSQGPIVTVFVDVENLEFANRVYFAAFDDASISISDITPTPTVTLTPTPTPTEGPTYTPTETPTITPTPTPTETPTITPTPLAGTNLLQNPGFEMDGETQVLPPAGWEWYASREKPDGTLDESVWPETPMTVYNGSYCAGKVTNWGRPAGGFYQSFPVVPGKHYNCTVFVDTPEHDATRTPALVRLGVDPTGGDSSDSDNIVWTDYTSAFDGWKQIGLVNRNAVESATDTMTLFLDFDQNEVGPWNGALFDEAHVSEVIDATTTSTWITY